MTSTARADQLLTWLSEPSPPRVGFATLYFDIVDTAGHRYGVESAEVNRAIADVDAAIGRLVDGLDALHFAANIVVVSDHGMADVSPQQVIDLDQLIDPDAVRYVWPPGPLAGIEPASGQDAEVRAALIGAHDHVECWAREAMPERFHAGAHRRFPPIVCMADVGWTLLSSAYVRPYPVSGANHGYDPDDPSMRAVFIASGPDLRAGATLPDFDNVDVYSLLTQLLRIQGEPSDGDASVFKPALN